MALLQLGRRRPAPQQPGSRPPKEAPAKGRLRWAIRTARFARATTGRRTIDAAQAEVLIAAVAYAGRWWPGRIACVERSLAATLAAALLGYRLRWCLGVRFLPPPINPHAWVAIDGHGPIAEDTLSGWHHHAALTI